MLTWVVFWLVSLSLLRSTAVAAPKPLRGRTSAVYNLLTRLLPKGGREHFVLTLDDDDNDDDDNNTYAYFRLESNPNDGRLHVTGTSASDLSAGIGWYLRHYCNMTIGWPRGGGSHIVFPNTWPIINKTRIRQVPWSYLMNVCTHSYSLGWYDWADDWERFIDWMSLSGINLVLALTGQEEIQYKVFRKLGLEDGDIRSWFNGPAFLTWSRGQNEYGNNICGPLPKSWMKDQWDLQRSKILPRLRELGIVGQLPGFQGNVPIQLKDKYRDANITQEGDTGWVDSLDPLYGKISDLWMKTLLQDFGTDHWYQLDGYFNGGTAPWFLESHDNNKNVSHNDAWYQRGLAVYRGMNRTDPDAVWSYQGFAFVGWSTSEQASYVKGFVDAAPKDKFVVIDMGFDVGEWTKWNNASFFGTPFVWTTLHNFGGSNGIKGDLKRVNRMPFEALAQGTSIFGAGATPEGIDQNPAYYEFVFDHVFHDEPIQDLHAYMVERSYRRYSLVSWNENVSRAWSLLVDSSYSRDFSVYDTSGIIHLKESVDDTGLFEKDRYTPKPILCKIFWAWKYLLDAAMDMSHPAEPFIYDLVNLGREVLAQISTPASLNLTIAANRQRLVRDEIARAGNFYIELLNDTDSLVATDAAFLLGPWIESARQWGTDIKDCPSFILGGDDCSHFYEFNARVQLTTWNPVRHNSSSIPPGPIDYAGKHWSGLIRDYYGVRAALLMQQALKDQRAGLPLNQTEVDRFFALHAYNWTTSLTKYATTTTGDPWNVSRHMFQKYKHWFASCPSITDESGLSWDLWSIS